MADEADMAKEIEELALKHALAHRKAVVNLPPKGYCYNCDEPLKPEVVDGKRQHRRIFCDRDCADDWERLQASKARRVAV